MAEVSENSFIPEALPGYTADMAGQIGLLWELIKAPLIVPLLRISVYICLAMSIMVFMERLYMGVVIILVKLFWKKPEKRYKWEPMKDDLEMGNGAFPMVLVQIPMFNEKEASLWFLDSPLSSHTHTRRKMHMLEERKGDTCLIFMAVSLQVYKISIGAACNLSWPADRLVIQVLDDSTDLVIKVQCMIE